MSRPRKMRRQFQRSANFMSEEMIHSVTTTPAKFMLPFMCDAAWSSWYGSSPSISVLRDEIIESGIRLEGFSRSDLKLMEDGRLISTVLLDDERRKVLEACLGKERVQEIMPLSKLDEKTREIIGPEIFDSLQKQIKSSSTIELLGLAISGVPQLGELMEVGGFSHELCTVGVMLGAVLTAARNEIPRVNDVGIDFCVEMVVHLYLQMIPVRTIQACILMDHPRFDLLYPVPSELHEEVAQHSPIFETDLYWSAPLLLSASIGAMNRRFSRAEDRIDAVLETLQSFALATSPASRFTHFALWSVVTDANDWWGYFCEAISGLDVDIDLMEEAGIILGVDLISESLLSSAALNLDLVDRARVFRSTTQQIFSDHSFFDESSVLASKLDEVNKEVSEAVKGGKGDFELLANLSTKGVELSRQKGQMISNALIVARAVVEIAQIFVKALESSVAIQPGQNNVPEGRAIGCEVLDLSISPPNIENNMEAELLDINTRLETELKAAQAEVFRLGSANSALQARLESPSGTMDQAFRDLVLRNLLGQRLSPEDLLRFYSLLAPDRLCVLDSAWKSCRQSENFSNPERLNDHLCKLVFEYLNQVRSGTPMGQVGRELFAGAFAAKESQSVSQDQSMRSQREFIYNGEVRFFEYRLRTGNGWGVVEGMRIYFDIIDGKVVVAYVGPHLDQPSTN